MQRTIIAVFDNRGDAESAIDELASAGFERSQIRLSEGDPTGAPGSAARGATRHAGTGILDSIKNFFGNIFGTDDSENVQKYSDAVTRGHHVLTLTAADEPDIERAADIVEKWGPVDIDEKPAEWSGGTLASEAMRGGAGAWQQSASSSRQSAQGDQGSPQALTQGSMQGVPLQGSQQSASGAAPVTSVPGTQRPGVRVFEHPAEPPVAVEIEEIAEIDMVEMADADDDTYFRNHYNSNFAGGGERFDDYAPAYRYGADMANSETYRGRPWRDVEPQLRSDWEGRNPGSAWEKFKAAVRHGWDRIAHSH